LESLITSPTISGKQMYVGESQRPNLLTWFVTLNGVSMATDMAQRSIIIKVVRGPNDGPWWEETRSYIDQFRNEIVGDIIAALRSDPFPLANFSRWATWEQHVLTRLSEPSDAQRLILERQSEVNCELNEAELIEEYFAKQLWNAGYDPGNAQVRIPVSVAAEWFNSATGTKEKTVAISMRIKQMIGEGQLKRIASDPSRTHGRCVIWTGFKADVIGQSIANNLLERLAQVRRDDREEMRRAG
jgi:hypothetical protein